MPGSDKGCVMLASFRSVFIGAALAIVAGVANAANLGGVATVNVTSDTAATAKNMALASARRQIINDALSQYTLPDQLQSAISESKPSDLQNLIASTEISGEQQSDTTYSATVSMTIDATAATNWLNANGVQNWLPNSASGDTFVVIATLSDPMANWIELQNIARTEKIDLRTKYINARTVTIELPVAARREFSSALRGSGWRVADDNGTLRIAR